MGDSKLRVYLDKLENLRNVLEWLERLESASNKRPSGILLSEEQIYTYVKQVVKEIRKMKLNRGE